MRRRPQTNLLVFSSKSLSEFFTASSSTLLCELDELDEELLRALRASVDGGGEFGKRSRRRRESWRKENVE